MKLSRIYLETSMSLGFDGLREIAKKDRRPLNEDTSVIFMNKAQSAFKIVVNNAYIVHYKNGRRRIPLDAIRHLPQNFGGTEMEVTSAVKDSLRKELGEWG